MKKLTNLSKRYLGGLLLLLCLSSCGFNAVISADEDVKASWAEVENQYKRRADLIPSLVATVKGSAHFEQETLEKVIQARSQLTKLNIDSNTIADPQQLLAFEKAQSQLSGALSRLMVVAEKYPDLKASAAFQTLQAQLEGTENRIAVARRRFIEQVALYNKLVLNFPTLIGARLRGKEVRPTFQGDNSAANPPPVSF